MRARNDSPSSSLEGATGISAGSSLARHSLSVWPRQPEVSVFPRVRPCVLPSLQQVFSPGEPRAAVRIRQAAPVVNHRRGRLRRMRSAAPAGGCRPSDWLRTGIRLSWRQDVVFCVNTAPRASADPRLPYTRKAWHPAVPPPSKPAARARESASHRRQPSLARRAFMGLGWIREGLPMDCIHAKHGILPFSLGRPPSAGADPALRA